jgi:hypothetical protein
MNETYTTIHYINIDELDNYISKYFNDIKLISEVKNKNKELKKYKVIKWKQIIKI